MVHTLFTIYYTLDPTHVERKGGMGVVIKANLLRWRVSYHTSAIIVSGLRPPLYSWFFFLNEANHCSSCFSSLISKSYLAVQPYYKRQKHEGNPEKFLRRRSPYINGHTHREGQGYIFSGRFVNQVNDFSNSLYYKQLLQWLVEGVT